MTANNPQTLFAITQMVPAKGHLATVAGPVTLATGVIDTITPDGTDLFVIIPVGTFIGAATMTVTLEESSTLGSGYAAITSGGFTALSTANDIAMVYGRVMLGNRLRYIRAVATYAGNGTTEFAPISVIGIMMNLGNSPTALTLDVNLQS